MVISQQQADWRVLWNFIHALVPVDLLSVQCQFVITR